MASKPASSGIPGAYSQISLYSGSRNTTWSSVTAQPTTTARGPRPVWWLNRPSSFLLIHQRQSKLGRAARQRTTVSGWEELPVGRTSRLPVGAYRVDFDSPRTHAPPVCPRPRHRRWNRRPERGSRIRWGWDRFCWTSLNMQPDAGLRDPRRNWTGMRPRTIQFRSPCPIVDPPTFVTPTDEPSDNSRRLDAEHRRGCAGSLPVRTFRPAPTVAIRRENSPHWVCTRSGPALGASSTEAEVPAVKKSCGRDRSD